MYSIYEIDYLYCTENRKTLDVSPKYSGCAAFEFFCVFSVTFLFRSTSYDDDTIDTSHIQSSRMYTQLLLLLEIELSINTIETFFNENYCSGNFDSFEQRIVSFAHTCELLRGGSQLPAGMNALQIDDVNEPILWHLTFARGRMSLARSYREINLKVSTGFSHFKSSACIWSWLTEANREQQNRIPRITHAIASFIYLQSQHRRWKANQRRRWRK